MVIWHGVLKVKSGKREEYIDRLRQEGFIEKFLAQPGNVFYTIGASIHNEDEVIVCDGWIDKTAFEAHDTSKEVDVWRSVYSQYVTGCVSNLYEW